MLRYLDIGSFLYLDKNYVYEYNNTWKDQLSKLTVNGVEEVFEYNSIGLPTKYRNEDVIWDKRNLLADYKNVLFTYDGTGMRLSKSTYIENDNGERVITSTTNFEYDGDTLLSETNGNDVIKFIYGISGLIGFLYNGTPYYYVRNMLGDVKSIKDANGTVIDNFTSFFKKYGYLLQSKTVSRKRYRFCIDIKPCR